MASDDLVCGHGAVSSQEANRESRDKVWPSGKDLSFVFWGVLTLLWASLVAHLVKNLPAIRENWVRSLGWEDPLEGRAWQPTPVFLLGRGAWQATVHRVAESNTTKVT